MEPLSWCSALHVSLLHPFLIQQIASIPSTAKNHPAQMTLTLPCLHFFTSNPEGLDVLRSFNCFYEATRFY